MDLQPLVIAAVSALFGALGKAASEHVVQWVSPTARLKKAEALAKKTAPPPAPAFPQFVIPESLAMQAKQVELVQVKDELALVQRVLRRMREEHEVLSLERAEARALRSELEVAQAQLRLLRETCDANALELAKLSAELSLSRAHNHKLVADIEELRTQEPVVRQPADKVLPEFRVERIRTRGGASATPSTVRDSSKGKSHG